MRRQLAAAASEADRFSPTIHAIARSKPAAFAMRPWCVRSAEQSRSRFEQHDVVIGCLAFEMCSAVRALELSEHGVGAECWRGEASDVLVKGCVCPLGSVRTQRVVCA